MWSAAAATTGVAADAASAGVPDAADEVTCCRPGETGIDYTPVYLFASLPWTTQNLHNEVSLQWKTLQLKLQYFIRAHSLPRDAL